MPFAGAYAIKCRRGTGTFVEPDYRSGYIRFLYVISGSCTLLGCLLLIPAVKQKWFELLYSSILLIVTGIILLVITCFISERHQSRMRRLDTESNDDKKDESEATNETTINEFLSLEGKF